MATNVTLSQAAYDRLAGLKQGPGDSFSKVVLRHFTEPANTAGELLDRYERMGAPPVDLARLKTITAHRGRRRAA